MYDFVSHYHTSHKQDLTYSACSLHTQTYTALHYGYILMSEKISYLLLSSSSFFVPLTSSFISIVYSNWGFGRERFVSVHVNSLKWRIPHSVMFCCFHITFTVYKKAQSEASAGFSAGFVSYWFQNQLQAAHRGTLLHWWT